MKGRTGRRGELGGEEGGRGERMVSPLPRLRLGMFPPS